MLSFKHYRKKNGQDMLYINGSNRVSVGLLGGWAPYGKNVTNGQRNLVEKALVIFDREARPFTGDVTTHSEMTPVKCGPFMLAYTDVANIGGHQTGADGAFIIKDGRILNISNGPFPE